MLKQQYIKSTRIRCAFRNPTLLTYCTNLSLTKHHFNHVLAAAAFHSPLFLFSYPTAATSVGALHTSRKMADRIHVMGSNEN